MKIVTVLGARPQFVKAAAVSRAISRARGVEERLLHTGQHYDPGMSEIFFRQLGIPAPHRNLGVGSSLQGAQTARMLEAIEACLVEERPDWVLVYGDTNSTLAGALAAAKLRLRLAHVEAGLRSFNRRMPEEVNRVVADHLSDLLLVPTEAARGNLAREGIAGAQVRMVGDVMLDAVLHHGAQARNAGLLEGLGLAAHTYILGTCHRAENTDEPRRLKAIVDGLRIAARRWPVVLPIHPRTRKALLAMGEPMGGEDGIRWLDPVGYLEMTALEQGARLIVTDSGGVQKEAFFHQVPCVTLRNETEWVELVETGWNRLLPPADGEAVGEGILSALDAGRPASPARLFGDGHAGEKILAALRAG